MSEFKKSPNQSALARTDELRDAQREINYRLIVSREAHEQAIVNARAFTMDMIYFLWTDTEEKMSRMQADSGVIQLLPVLFESSKDSRIFKSTEIKPYIDYRGYPFLIRCFRNIPLVADAANEEKRIIARIEAQLSPQFEIMTRWGLTPEFTPTFALYGHGPISFSPDITLIAPPEKIETPEQAYYYFGSLLPQTSDTDYQLYQDDSIIRHHLGPEELREGARIEHWHFLGEHRSGLNYRQYFVYGMYDLLGLTR